MLFHIRDECEVVKYGFNFIPWGSPSGYGFVLKYAPHRAISLRYSKVKKRLFFTSLKSDPVATANFNKLMENNKEKAT